MNTISNSIRTPGLYALYLASTGISKDTRSIIKGNLYFALKGANFNGNLFAADALDKGAEYAIVDEALPSFKNDKRVLYVDNVLETLQKLARHHRRQINTKIIGLTGSNGKTTTKELLYAILKKFHPESYATSSNYNNHIGVPLTLLSIPSTAKFAIIEMGSNQPGDIKQLCDIAEPEYGLITNIGKTHLEKLINEEGVFQEKSALFESIKAAKGVFFRNDSDTFLSKLKYEKSFSFTEKRTLYSTITKVKKGPGLIFELEKKGVFVRIRTHLFGDFNLENIAAAISIAEYFSVPINVVKDAIESYIPDNMRSQIVQTERGNTVILDAYNSNPYSLRKAVDEFLKLESNRKIAVIGDMLELGETSEDEHSKIISYMCEHPDVETYFVGPIFKNISGKSAKSFTSVNECKDKLEKESIDGAFILLKGSRGIQLEKLLPIF